MPEITVILPSLNVRKYITECLDSVIHQTMNDLEILIVDGGSTDGTLEICQDYANKDARIRIINAVRKSYGYQMNVGLNEAKGVYIAFLETDDCYCPYALERLHTIIENDGLDYVKGTTYGFWEDEKGRKRIKDEDKVCLVLPRGEEVFSPQNHPQLLMYDYHVWNGLYRRSFFKVNNIKFNETKGAAFQDIGFIVQCIIKANKVRYIDLPVYWYRRSNDNSSVYNESGFKYLADEYEKLAETFQCLRKEQRLFICQRMLIQIWTRFDTMYKGERTWQSVEKNLQRLRMLLERAKDSGTLFNSCLEEIHDRMLRLLLAGEYAKLKNSSWIIEPLLQIIKPFDKGNVLIYGAGRRGRMLLHSVLRLKKYLPLAFVDSNPEMWGEYVAGIKVISLPEAREKYPNANYLIAVKGHEDEIKSILIANGVLLDNIIIFNINLNYWQQVMDYILGGVCKL